MDVLHGNDDGKRQDQERKIRQKSVNGPHNLLLELERQFDETARNVQEPRGRSDRAEHQFE
jgi:hypothetical protein